MKKLIKALVVLGNIIIIGLASRWFSKDNFYEPLIVVVGQLISLLSIALDSGGNVSLTNFNRTTLKGRHTGSGDFKADKLDDSDVNFNS